MAFGTSLECSEDTHMLRSLALPWIPGNRKVSRFIYRLMTPSIRLVPLKYFFRRPEFMKVSSWKNLLIGLICAAGLAGSAICIWWADASVPNVITVAAGITALISGIISALFGALQPGTKVAVTINAAGNAFGIFFLVSLLGGILIGLSATVHPQGFPLDAGVATRIGMGCSVVTAALFAVVALLKHRAVQGATSRYSMLNTLHKDIGNIIQDSSRKAEEKKRDIVKLCLRGLIVIFNSGVSTRIRDLVYRGKPYATAVSAFYLTPGGGKKPLSFCDYALPNGATEAQRPVFEWLIKNHRPAAFDARLFDTKVSEAREWSGRSWKTKFLQNWSDRHRSVSAAGYVSATKKTLFTNDASTCLAFESRYYEKLDEQFPDPDDGKRWVQIRSFVACAVGQQEEPSDVLWVCSTSAHSFMHDDRNILELLAAMIDSAFNEIDRAEQKAEIPESRKS